MENGWVGNHGTTCQGACVRAHNTICRLSRWDGKGRWDVAGPLFKSLFIVPTEATLAFPNGASQARHLMLGLVIPVSLSVVSALIVATAHDSERIGVTTLFPYLCLHRRVKTGVLSSPVVSWCNDLGERCGLTVRDRVGEGDLRGSYASVKREERWCLRDRHGDWRDWTEHRSEIWSESKSSEMSHYCCYAIVLT